MVTLNSVAKRFLPSILNPQSSILLKKIIRKHFPLSNPPVLPTMDPKAILTWLHENDPKKLSQLWKMADDTRAAHVGNEVHLRGLIEISNYCARECAYCGINRGNLKIERYRMTETEIMECVRQIVRLGYGTVVMQSGEDYGMTTTWIADLIRRIKSETNLAITLSLGERPTEDLITWKIAGADRYLLRFETSDPVLYRRIHPPLQSTESANHRIEMLQTLRSLGYEIGSGIMIGIPGQSYESLARDILLFRELDLDMIGVGPYLESPDTLLVKESTNQHAPHDSVPNSELLTYKTIALARLVCPDANIPSTTALATINKSQGREQGLQRGANIVMPNVTPLLYRSKYVIYPGKACLNEDAITCSVCIRKRIESIGRSIGHGRGSRRKENHDDEQLK